jgi:hypothetical protein
LELKRGALPDGLESKVQRRRSVTTRIVAVLAVAAPVALAMSGCSPGGDSPSIFPAVEATPPRTDTTMDPNQVQQATEALITDRNRLSAEAQGSGQSDSAAAAKPAAATGSANGTLAAGR